MAPFLGSAAPVVHPSGRDFQKMFQKMNVPYSHALLPRYYRHANNARFSRFRGRERLPDSVEQLKASVVYTMAGGWVLRLQVVFVETAPDSRVFRGQLSGVSGGAGETPMKWVATVRMGAASDAGFSLPAMVRAKGIELLGGIDAFGIDFNAAGVRSFSWSIKERTDIVQMFCAHEKTHKKCYTEVAKPNVKDDDEDFVPDKWEEGLGMSINTERFGGGARIGQDSYGGAFTGSEPKPEKRDQAAPRDQEFYAWINAAFAAQDKEWFDPKLNPNGLPYQGIVPTPANHEKDWSWQGYNWFRRSGEGVTIEVKAGNNTTKLEGDLWATPACLTFSLKDIPPARVKSCEWELVSPRPHVLGGEERLGTGTKKEVFRVSDMDVAPDFLETPARGVFGYRQASGGYVVRVKVTLTDARHDPRHLQRTVLTGSLQFKLRDRTPPPQIKLSHITGLKLKKEQNDGTSDIYAVEFDDIWIGSGVPGGTYSSEQLADIAQWNYEVVSLDVNGSEVVVGDPDHKDEYSRIGAWQQDAYDRFPTSLSLEAASIPLRVTPASMKVRFKIWTSDMGGNSSQPYEQIIPLSEAQQ